MKWLDRYKRSVAKLTLERDRRELNNSTVAGFRAKAEPGDEEYRERVARPVMSAIDQMPAEWRELVHEHGYVDVYRAWRRGMSPAQVRALAETTGGLFILAA